MEKQELKKFWDYLILKDKADYQTPELMDIMIDDFLNLPKVDEHSMYKLSDCVTSTGVCAKFRTTKHP